MDVPDLLRPLDHTLRHVRRQRYFQCCRHRGDFADDLVDDTHHLGMIQGLGHLVIDQHRQGVEDAIPAHLFPLAPPDVFRELARNSGCDKQVSNLQQALALMSHQFADRHIPLLIVIDHAWRHDLRIDERDPTDHTVPFQSRDDAIFRIDAILQSENDGPICQHRFDLRHDLVQVVCLDRKNDQIRFGQLARVRGGGRMHDRRCRMHCES